MNRWLILALLLCSGCGHSKSERNSFGVCYVDELTPETAALLNHGCDRVQTVGKVVIDDNVYYRTQ